MRMQEGQQYFVNRITFVGNTTTRDNVIRREMRLVEDGVVQHRGAEVQRQAAESARLLQAARRRQGRSTSRRRRAQTNKVDVKLKLEEQNRNQLTFGAGVSQFEGFFGQLSFQTVELPRPRREPHAVGAAGRRAQNYSGRVHRAVPVRPAHHRRRRRLQAGRSSYIGQFTQESTGGEHGLGFPLGRLLAHVRELQLRARAGQGDQPDSTRSPACCANNPFLPTRC